MTAPAPIFQVHDSVPFKVAVGSRIWRLTEICCGCNLQHEVTYTLRTGKSGTELWCTATRNLAATKNLRRKDARAKRAKQK